MSCDGGYLGFPIGIKNRKFVKDIPMIIHLQFGFIQLISFREEDLWNFSQSEHIIGPGSHVEYPTGTKNRNFVDHPRNIPAKFGSNWSSDFGEEAWNVKSLQTTDAKWWSRWTKKESNTTPTTKTAIDPVSHEGYTVLVSYKKTSTMLLSQVLLSMIADKHTYANINVSSFSYSSYAIFLVNN